MLPCNSHNYDVFHLPACVSTIHPPDSDFGWFLRSRPSSPPQFDERWTDRKPVLGRVEQLDLDEIMIRLD
jgi:hypothetical protein